ncbi:MAG TPA: hypothetical protein VFV90_09455, partial [Usitatibacter sp.]|nr:hypothetical protein [Usitatibacter sp.]
GAAGSQETYTVDVTQAGATRSFAGTVRVAAAGTPVCTITREPSGDVPVFTTPVRLVAACNNAPTSYSWSGGYDLRPSAAASTVTHINIVNETATVPIDVSATNANGPGAVAGIGVRYVASPPACRIRATPAGRVLPNQSVTLTAECDGSPTSYSWAHGVTGATIVVNPAVNATYTLRASNAAGVGPAATHIVPVAIAAPGLRDFTGHWWGGQVEDGWGMTLNQHGDRLFGVLYFYDGTGEPTWAVMPGGTWNADFTVFTGDLYAPTGRPFTSYDASQLVVGAPTGSMTLTFVTPTQFTASYRLGYSQFDPARRSITTFGQKVLQPLILNSGANPSGLVVPDMWWGGPAQNGWGISINQRSSEVFAAWFTYGADRRPTWFIVSGSSWSGNTLNGTLFRVTGRPWLGVPHDATAVTPVDAGAATIGFASASAGTFSYNVAGVPGSKVILRQDF